MFPAVKDRLVGAGPVGGSQRDQRFSTMADINAFLGLFRCLPLPFQRVQLCFSPLELLTELQHFPFLRGNGGQETGPVIVVVKGYRGADGGDMRVSSRGPSHRRHGTGLSHVGIQGSRQGRYVDGKVQGQALLMACCPMRAGGERGTFLLAELTLLLELFLGKIASGHGIGMLV